MGSGDIIRFHICEMQGKRGKTQGESSKISAAEESLAEAEAAVGGCSFKGAEAEGNFEGAEAGGNFNGSFKGSVQASAQATQSLFCLECNRQVQEWHKLSLQTCCRVRFKGAGEC